MEGKREEAIKKVVDYYSGLQVKVKGFRGFITSGILQDPRVFNMSLWKTKEDTDNHHLNDKEYATFLGSLKPLTEQQIENNDYKVLAPIWRTKR